MIKINPLDAHDRFLHFKKQNFSIEECCQNLIDQKPFGPHPFYIFAHARTDDDGVTKRLIWDPRLTKPRAQTNSMLFKAYPGSDIVKIIWMIPARELWAQYKKGHLTECSTISQSIYDFENNKDKLEQAENDDLDDETIHKIYLEISQEAKRKKMMTKLYLGK